MSSFSSTNSHRPGRTLTQITNSPDYFPKVSAIVAQLQYVTSQPSALTLLYQATELLGADASVFASFVRDDETHDSYRFLLACDPQWCQAYEKISPFPNNPWLTYACSHSDPILGHKITVYNQKQEQAVKVAENYGFRSSVVIPAPSSGGISRLGVLCVGSNQAHFFEDTGYPAFKFGARSLAMELHEWWVRVVRAELIAEADITPGDLLLLRLARKNPGTKEIARQLQTSIRSVDSRFLRLNAKLGMHSRKACIHMAIEYGLI